MSAAAPKSNEEQRRAVEHGGGPLLVLAGPGTGKTGVLISRVAHLVGEGDVDPRRVLVLTFSRRAADEMRERLAERVSEAAFVEFRTFHSFALSVVRKHSAALGFSRPPEIMATDEQWALIAELLEAEDPEEWGLAPGAFERPAAIRQVYDLVLRAQEHLLGPEEMRELARRSGKPYLARAAEVLARFRGRLAGSSRVDHEGVVRHVLTLLQEERAAREGLVGRYEHVLVDDFQDTSGSQLELLRRLMPDEKPNVFCVGDDAQSICGFRGARVENVREFKKRFPGAEEVRLRTNYRSASGIVALAEDVIAGDGSRPKRERQVVHSAKPGTVLSGIHASPREEAEWISDRIVELNGAYGVPFQEIAVLRRSLLGAEPLLDALTSRGIPVDLSAVRGTSYARPLFTLLSAADGEELGPIGASQAFTSPLAGVSSAAVRSLRRAASGRSLFELVGSGDLVGGVGEEDMERARGVVRAVQAARAEKAFSGKVNTLWKNLPGTKKLFESHREDAEAARAVMEAMAFLRAARAYAAVSRNPSVPGFLLTARVLHEDPDAWAPPAEGAVRIMTVHASKGLEFEAVFVGGLVEDRPGGMQLADQGLLADGKPTPRAALERRHLFEDRRLLYVAITRAKTHLYLTGVAEGAEAGAKVPTLLRELEDRLVELAGKSRTGKFWTSREEAIEELRRTACDESLAKSARFAACRTLAELGERPESWWRYLEQTPGGPRSKQEPLDLRSGELLRHMDCPRRAFMERLAPGSGAHGGRMRFGSAFREGVRRFLREECDSLEKAVLESMDKENFGGRAVREYWRRQAREALSSCEEWARELGKAVRSVGGTWSVEFGEHRVRGDHDPVVEVGGRRTVVRTNTGRSPVSKAQAASDAGLALEALGAGADGAKLVYPRKLAYGKPAERALETPEGWKGNLRTQVERALLEIAAGEIPARPRDAGVCEGCAFRTVCPLHAEDEPWLG